MKNLNDRWNRVIGGAAIHVTEGDIPDVDLPRHPVTGEVLPRVDALGVPHPVTVRVFDDEQHVPTPFFDESTGTYRC